MQHMIKLLLQVSQSPDRTVEIINAIASSWPFLLTLLLVVIVILKWKSFGRFLSKINKVAGKTPMGEFNFETTKEQNLISAEEIQTKSEAPLTKESSELESKKDPNFYDVYLTLKENKNAEAEEMFKEMQSKETDNIRKEQNELIFLWQKYFHGQKNTIIELENKTTQLKNNDSIWRAHKYIGDCYTHAKNYEVALLNYTKAYECAEKDNDKVDIAGEISTVLYESEKKEESIKYLKTIKDQIKDPESKAKILKFLSNIYDKEKKWILKSLALEMAVSLSPNDTNLLFDVAYAYSDTENLLNEALNKLSMLHYIELTKLNSKSQYGFNNLGVAYNRLELPGKAIKNYKKSIELGNSLAASNMANKYMQQGFHDEAREILDKVKDQDNVSPNVWSSLTDLSKKEKEEDEKINQYLQEAQKEQMFLRKFSSLLFDSQEHNVVFGGKWRIDTELIDLTQSLNPNYYSLKFTARENTFSINLIVDKYLALLGSGSFYPSSGGISNSLDVFAILNHDLQKINFLFYDKGSSRSFFFEATKE